MELLDPIRSRIVIAQSLVLTDFVNRKPVVPDLDKEVGEEISIYIGAVITISRGYRGENP